MTQAQNLADLSQAVTAGGLMFRNLLLNAGGRINQRGYVSGAATSGANQYTLDRWRVVTSGQNLAFALTSSAQTLTAPAGGLEQVIEGINIEGGTYCLAWTGTATATVNGNAVANGGNFTLPANTDATVRFSSGTVYQPQLELGRRPTPFERRSIGIEIALCMRYFEALGVNGRNVYNQGATGALMDVIFNTTKRVPPTLTYVGSMPAAENTNTPTAVGLDRSRIDGGQLIWTGSGGPAVGTCGRMLNGGTLQFNAEL
jgi:hypothetical protein